MKRVIRATVKVTWVDHHGERQKEQRERHFSLGTKKRVIDAWKEHERKKLRKRIPATRERRVPAGSLAKDTERYYALVRHVPYWMSHRAKIEAWIKAGLGDKARHVITREDVLRVRSEWIASRRVSPKTCNNRVSALRDLYKKLDGETAETPCDGIKPLLVPRTPPRVVSPELVNRVLATLQERATSEGERGRPAPHAAQDRARLMVLASTGKRPCEIERAEPGDVDFERRVWAVKDAKGGWSEGLYLNDEMLAAWQEFARVNAWGKIPDHFSRRLRDAGWPNDVRPYNLRHSTWITASERGADLADIQAGAGHKHMATTRRHYVPVLNSRMQKLSELLDGRFGWRPGLAPSETQG